MENILKENIINYIRQKDPRKIIIKKIEPNNDYSSGIIEYNADNLILHQNISVLKDEEYVRAYLVVKLVTDLRYPINSIELEKEYEAGRPKTIKPRIDIIVREKKREKKPQRTFLFIEVKAPDKFETDKDYIEGQLFKLSAIEDKESPVQYLVYYSLKNNIASFEDQAIIIDYTSYQNHPSWLASGKITLDEIPEEYGAARKLVYVRKKSSDLYEGEKNLDSNVGRERFTYLRKDLHNVLWGGGAMDYNEVFSNLVKLFLAKIYDEENTPDGKPYTFQIEFKDDKPESPIEVYNKINDLFKRAEREYLGYSAGEQSNAIRIDPEKISVTKITYVVEQLQGISILENQNNKNGDVLGEFFEAIVSTGFKQYKGQFFTHTNIVRFVLNALALDELALELVSGKEDNLGSRLPFICDPACGSGTFLIEAMKFVTNAVTKKNSKLNTRKQLEFVSSNFPELKKNRWTRDYIYGCEISRDLGLATKVNMVLHGDGNINIFVGDPNGNGLNPFAAYEVPNKKSILSKSSRTTGHPYDKPVNESFDIIISNPPFSIDKKALPPIDELANTFLYYNKPNSENLFIERWYQLMKEGGRLGVVLPEAVFDTRTNLYIRVFLYKYFKIKAIISLPRLAFQYTPTKTSLLFAQKKTKQEVMDYEAKFRSYANEYNRLKRRIAKYKNGEITNEHDTKTDLKRFLKHYLDEKDFALSSKEIILKYQDEITEIDRNWIWWVFGAVASKSDYSIFMAEVEEIGYKRTQRRELERPNELFHVDRDGNIIIDKKNPKTILDWFKMKVKWDN